MLISVILSAQTMFFNSAVIKLKKGMEDNFITAHETLLFHAKFINESQIAIELIMKGNIGGAAYRTVWVKPTEGDMIVGIAPGKWDAYWA